MKKIFKQLCKLFPNDTIDVTQSLNNYNIKPYKVYINGAGIWEFNWSPEFNTLKELDIHLDSKIEKYKKIY